MRFIPLAFLVINTPLTPPEVRARLAAALDRRARGGTGGAPRPLRGTVGLATFALRRVTRHGGALLPEFRGRIEPWRGGARLTGMVSLDAPSVFGLAVAALAAFAAGAGTLVGILMGEPVELLPLVPLGAVVLAWIFAVRRVAAETRRLRRLIGAVLDRSAADGLPYTR